MPRWRGQDQRDVKIIAQNTTLLCSTASTAFIFSTTLLLALSSVELHPTFIPCPYFYHSFFCRVF